MGERFLSLMEEERGAQVEIRVYNEKLSNLSRVCVFTKFATVRSLWAAALSVTWLETTSPSATLLLSSTPFAHVQR